MGCGPSKMIELELGLSLGFIHVSQQYFNISITKIIINLNFLNFGRKIIQNIFYRIYLFPYFASVFF